jgi:hypothetical protein
VKVHGIEIPAEAIKACEERMRIEPFRCLDIAIMAIRHGVNYNESDRFADRLIQWHRKRGNIKPVGAHRLWRWSPEVSK